MEKIIGYKMKISTLCLDIGGVLMTNGWDSVMRKNAIRKFDLEPEEFDFRHKQYFDLLEKDEISLDNYLEQVVFWKDHQFTQKEFKDYIFAQSKPYPDMIAFFTQLKKDYNLKIAVISNENRELAEYRIKYANLKSFVDNFFISSFLHCQKPDPHIYKIALDVMQKAPEEVFYIDDRKEHVDAAAKLGIRGLVQTSLVETRKALFDILE